MIVDNNSVLIIDTVENNYVLKVSTLLLLLHTTIFHLKSKLLISM